jgi:hypothetical protein
MLQWIRAFAQTTTYLGVVMIVAIWGGIYFLSNEANDRAHEDGLRQGSNLTRVFEDYISRAINGTDSELLVLRKLYEQDPTHFDFDHWIDNKTSRNSLTVHFSITGPDGIIRLSSLGPVQSTINIRHRENFRIHVGSVADDLNISQPSVGLLSGKPSIQLTRRILTPDGTFGGTIGASLDVLELEKLYNSIDIGRAGVISLIGFDGIIRAGSGRDPVASGFIRQSLAGRNLFRDLQQRPAGAYWTSLDSASSVAGHPKWKRPR